MRWSIDLRASFSQRVAGQSGSQDRGGRCACKENNCSGQHCNLGLLAPGRVRRSRAERVGQCKKVVNGYRKVEYGGNGTAGSRNDVVSWKQLRRLVRVGRGSRTQNMQVDEENRSMEYTLAAASALTSAYHFKGKASQVRGVRNQRQLIANICISTVGQIWRTLQLHR